MAYDAFGNYTGDQNDPYEIERLRQEEEDRKRREEEERLARLANVAAPVAPTVDAMGNQTGGFMDQLGARFGQAVDQRVQGVKDKFGQVQQAFEDPAKAFQERLDTAVAPVKPDEVVRKEQVETRADGSKVVKTTQEVPTGGQPQEAGAGRGFVNPAPVTPTAPTTSAALPADYNERIAQMESGNNPNIGYHDRARSSAFGKYGITDKAWSDAQRANPALAGVQKDQATPEQMEAAQQTVTSNNSRYLTKLGVEVNPNTLAAAHFIGAQGLANYLRDGSISEGAVKANGGYEKTKSIIDQRLGGVAAPASGAAMQQPVAPVAPPQAASQPAPAEPTAVSPYSLSTGQTGLGLRAPTAPVATASPVAQAIDAYQSVQNDPMALLKMRSDESVPAFLRERAGAQAYELLNRERKTAAAEQQVERMVASGDQTAIAKTLATKPKTEEGSFLKAVLYAKLGLTDLAKDEQEKLGAGTKWTSVTGPDGENALVKVAANGRPLEGVKANGTAFTENELVQYGGGGTLGKGASLSSEVYVDSATGQRYRSGFDNSGKSALVNIQGGAAYRGDPKNLKIQSIDTAAQKAEGAAAVKLKYAGPTSYTEAGAKAAGEFNFNNGTNIGYQSQQPGAPLVDLNTGKPVQVSSSGVITTTQTGTPGTAVTTTAPAVSGGASPQAITQGQAVNKVAQEQFVKTTAPEVNTQGNDGRDVASIRRQQLGIVSSNPSILNIYNGTGDTYDRARNVISKLLTGAYGEENSGDFYKDVKATGLGESERGAIEAMWNLNSSINSKTLKANAGAGAVSNADMKANKEANLGNFTETTALGALQVLNRSKFTGDMAAAKAAYLAANPGLNDDTKFNSAWAKESSKYTKAYEGIADARAEFLKPFRPPQGASKEQLDMFKDKVFKSFEMYPVPAFDNESGKWSYGTANAERAAARKLLGR